ncbi:Bgt-50727 [Blumeria graminis f. sp. tritici]|uniref:Bgt-50727 n=2 Tax=Blumeria graminis TaxID=34373 RepID=A0A9X9L9E2_BLUGR|nr:Bgt-50727 [Blumeria graminis f. sp. tritici]
MLGRPNGDDGIKGIVIDLDHSVSLNDDQKKVDSHLLTGTMKFTVLEMLVHAIRHSSKIQCTYRHYLESFFYVFLVGCI